METDAGCDCVKRRSYGHYAVDRAGKGNLAAKLEDPLTSRF